MDNSDIMDTGTDSMENGSSEKESLEFLRNVNRLNPTNINIIKKCVSINVQIVKKLDQAHVDAVIKFYGVCLEKLQAAIQRDCALLDTPVFLADHIISEIKQNVKLYQEYSVDLQGRSLAVPKQHVLLRANIPAQFRFQSSDSAAYTATYDFETLTVTAPDDHILHVELNRPECYNAMNKMFWREMLDCFRKIRDDRYCRAVIISGSGQLFSAGLDYSDMQDLTSQVAGKGDVARKAKFLLSLIAKYQESFNAVENCQKPVIAAIHGKCSGGGVDLICACDIRYCSADAFFEIEEVDVGMAADMGTLQRLPKIVGNDSLVREYAYSCAKIDPQEAKTIGLVGRVFPSKDAMMTAALSLAKVIASKSPVAIQGTKVALNFSRDHSVQDGLQFMTYWNMTMLQSEDVLKAAEATINKAEKPPKYSKL